MLCDCDKWRGWSCDGEYLITPNGDRITPEVILACLFWRQMEALHQVLYDWPSTVQ